ncbi:MAG: leucine-rich repeat domain-containing protein [Marinifilaceae bacterium]
MSELALQLIEQEKRKRTGKLDLGNCGLSTIPEELFDLTNLQTLNLSNNQIKDVWCLKKLTCLIKLDLSFNHIKYFSIRGMLTNLQSLNLRGNTLDLISFSEEHTNLQFLDLSYNELNNTILLMKLTNLQSLNLRDNECQDIKHLGNLTSLQSLDLGDNQIKDISTLGKLSCLQTLYLGNNQIEDISVLEKLTNLQALELNGNKIRIFSFLKKLTTLQTLELSHNQIKDVSFLKKLTNLLTLDLSGNQINDLSFLEKLTSLQTLILNNNSIEDSSFIEKLTKLQILNLRHNPIKDYSFLEKLTNLLTLDLSGNQINDLSFLEKLTSLQILKLNNNQIKEISIVEKLKNLVILDLNDNQIKNISFLEKLTSLQSLDLNKNQINDISIVKKLISLETLKLSSNNIQDYTFLKELTKLKTLNLVGNNISDISFLENFSNLETLILNFNEITDISLLGKLTSLQTLELRGNQIQDISFLGNLTKLQTLDLFGNVIENISFLIPLLKTGLQITKNGWDKGIQIDDNPIKTPPVNIVEKGREAILNWFEQIEKDGEAPLFEAKLMILGQGGAGKTTFANLQLDPNYQVEPGKSDSTLGIVVHKGKAFKHQNQNQQEIKAHLWDFGGQDIQKMLHQFFITENCLYVLVSDKRAENTNFDYWFQIINLLGPQSSVIVLENPKDIESANEDFALNKYRELFKELSIDCQEVNLQLTRKGDKTRWQLLNETISKKLSRLEIVNRPVPRKWSLIRDELTQLKEKKYITKDAFHTICSQPKIGLNIEQSNLCLYYLKELGDLVYFDDRDLCTHIFLDQNWLTQGMYYILSDKQIKDKKGRFTRKQAYQQWNSNGYNEEEKAMLLRLLLKDKFDICYELPHEKDVFITPLLLTNDKPQAWEYETNLRFRYQYSFIPHGMFSRLIVRIHEKIDAGYRWKTGVRLIETYNGTNIRAEVQQLTDPDGNQQVIDIRLNGSKEGCKHLLSFIRSAIEDLHKDFKNIQFSRIVACNCETCTALMKNGERPSFYDYERLKAKIQNRKYYEECGKSNFQTINIGQILSDVILENAANDNIDSEFLYRLKKMGLSMNQINNNNTINQSDFGNANASANAEASAEATSNVSIEIQNLLGETEMLKEDIEDERKLLQREMDNDEIDVTIRDIEKAEKAMEEIETAEKQNQVLPRASKNRLQRFMDDLNNEESSLHKTLKALRKGKDYGVSLAENYNKIAENIGLPSVPPFILKAVKQF